MTSKRAVLNYDAADSFPISHHKQSGSILNANKSIESLLHKQNEAVPALSDMHEQSQVWRKPSIDADKETQQIVSEHAENERSEGHTVYAENYQTAPLGPEAEDSDGEDNLIMIKPLGRATTQH